MSVQSSINLIQTKTGTPPQVAFLEVQLARIRVYALATFLISGVISGGMFYYIQSIVGQLNESKATLTQSIAAAGAKESLLVAIQARVKVAAEIVKSQKDWSKLFGSIQTLLGNSKPSSISLSDQNKVEIAFSTTSLDEVIAVVTAVSKEVTEKRIKSPILSSFTLGREGGYEVTITFVTLL